MVKKSTCLGLAIINLVVVLHNGDTGVKRVLSQGAKRYYHLPINICLFSIKMIVRAKINNRESILYY